MKDFLVFFSFFLFFSLKSCAFGVYIRNEVQSTKPPLQVEELPWLSFFDRKSSVAESKVKSQPQRKSLNLVSHSTLCPPGETGQFPYPPDCKRFINCWKGRGSIQVCAPGTLFNPETLECDFPGKVMCDDSFDGFGDSQPMPTGERYVRFPHQRPQIAHNQRIARKNQNGDSQLLIAGPRYYEPSQVQSQGNETQGREVRPQCALGATGLYPHPYDCTKFLKCWSGNTFIQNCGPGTFFNPLISACDHPRNVPCAHEEKHEPVQPDEIPVEDNHLPEESVQYEHYQKVTPGVKAPSKKGRKEPVKHDPESPTYDADPIIVSSTPKSEAEDMEPPAVTKTHASTHRQPKVVNTGNQQNQFPNAHGKEPASYLTPPQYDVYGNVISSNNNNQAKLGVQPGQSGYPNKPKVQSENPSAYPSNPFSINYPPQGPYSTLNPGKQHKLTYTEQPKEYYGHMLSKKHPHHPHHPHHLHHPHHGPLVGPSTWFFPQPFQPQAFPHYAPYHPFSPKMDGVPQTSFGTGQVMHIPYYPTYITQGGEMCSFSPTPNQGSGIPKCEPGSPLPFYNPNQSTKPSGFPQTPQPAYNPYFIPTGTQTQTPNKVNSESPQPKPSFNTPQSESQNASPQHGVIPTDLQPPSRDKHGSDYNPQLQINLNPNSPNHPSGYNPYQRPSIPVENQQTSTLGSYDNVPQTPNTFNRPSYNPQFPNYPKQQENRPTGSVYTPQTNPQPQQNTPHGQPASEQPQLPPYYPKREENNPTGSSYTPQISNPQTQQNTPASQLPSYYPKQPENYPTASPNTPQINNPTGDVSKPGTPQTPQYQPYWFYYYPVDSNLYPSYYGNNPDQNANPPKQPETPNHSETHKPDPEQGQKTVPDPFTGSGTQVRPQYTPRPHGFEDREHPQEPVGGPIEVPDSFDNENCDTDEPTTENVRPQYKPDPIYGGSSQPGQAEVPDPFSNKNYDSSNPTPIYVRPGWPQQPSKGQVQEPDPFDNKNKIFKDDRPGDNVHGTPYYPSYNPKDSTRPGYSSNIKSTESYPKESATFPPFPGSSDQQPSGSIKTGVKTKFGTEKDYLLGQIDVRTRRQEEEDTEDAENIPPTEPPSRRRGSENVDEAIMKKPSASHPDKYSQPKETNTEERTTTTPKPRKEVKKPYIRVRQPPPNGQIVRLRNGASHLDGYLEMKDPKSKWGLVCDYPGEWGIAEATVACRELGFIRGAELSWQGYPIKSEGEELHVAVQRINCTGSESSLSECKVTHDDPEECDVGRNAVGLRCFDNLASHCQPGEILYNQHCYKLHGKENPDDPWIKTEKASEECKKYGGKLVDITSQYENDFISEWLIKKHPDVTSVATGGIGISVLGRPMWLWEGTTDPMVYERWWSGWSGDQGVPKGSINGPLCIVLRKTFSCADDDAQKKIEPTNDEETCSADYFFWDVEDCGELRTSVFICERPMDDIGCVVGNGEGYVGTANTTASGLPCLPWDHPKVVEGLARRGAAQERSSRLVGHNYCRNLGNPDRHPWCFVEGRGNSEYCAIPQCWDSVSGSYSRSSGGWSSCDSNHFECKPGECIKKDWVCDGQKDCTSGRDEDACKVFIQEFTTERNKKMRGRGNERWPNINENICAKMCLENKNFRCKSFSYNYRDKDCLLSDTNTGLSGQVAAARGWVYHERTSDSVRCTIDNGYFGCQTGKCINISNVCDGKKNCDDGSDERDCERLGYRIGLTGSEEKHKGRVEVKILGKWGVICDDMFDMRDAEVVCRELGFKLGASEVLKHSEFPVEKPLFLIDHLDCRGNETSIRECSFPGWGKHNCGPEEVVGVSCRVPGIDCPDGHWQCKRSKECISLAYLCDDLKDCDDGTDEDKLMCGSPTQIRLQGGPNATSGRLEIRRYDIWGTVCHDDFSIEAGRSVCSLLGFNGPSVVKKSAYFGPGKGPIWLDSGLCFVNETDLDECTKHIGFQNNCKHNEDVSLICSQEEFNEKSSAIKPIAASSADDEAKRSEEKLRQILLSECSGQPKTKSKILHDKYEKVVGGNDVAREALPWQASVRVRSGSGKSVHWCGAIVISPYHVLTAGHCLRDYNKAAYFIRVGDYDTKVSDPHEREYGIEHLYMHPDFSKSINLNNDIGLVKVKGEIPLGEHIKPACLAPSLEMYQPGTNCSVSGWGSVSANAAGYARTLRRAFVPIIEPSVCRAPFVYGESLSDGMFCAGHLDGGVDSCQGDSGGPLMCQHEGREYLFGITSWGHGCGRANKPGVYTNVAFYTEWIQQKIQASIQ